MSLKILTLLVLLSAISANTQAAGTKAKRHMPAPAPEPELSLPPADAEQLAAAARIYLGDYACEYKQSLQLSPDARFAGYVDLRFGKQHYTTKPVLSSTGALRLEDVRGQVLMVQIPVKSMLMDVKAGHRMADDCVNARQDENLREMAHEPPGPGLGIDPVRAAADAKAAAAAAKETGANGPAAGQPPIVATGSALR